MLSQRRCPCCIGTEPEYRQHVSRKAQKTTKFQKSTHQYISEGQSEELEGKPYAYLGEGEIWANGAFMKILQRKYGHGGHHCCPHSPRASPYRLSPAMRQASPTRLVKVPSPICLCCHPATQCVSPIRTASPPKRRSPSSSRRRRVKSPSKSSCTYRVSPIKSKNEIQDGDLIIETSDHKYLKVLGPEDLSDGDDFYVLIDPGRKSKRRARSSSTSSSSSSSSSSSEEVYVAKRFLSPGAAQIPRRFTCHKLTGPCFCLCCTRCNSSQMAMMN
ncbi:hypothetical protein TcWFU_005440 [Taenia crassiceps]|uniref:Uncharacterized protein n=1 Tax=Taenia crassiceps TaxID=6207 RepID=A0ABR4QDD4_9CEST